jgi:hypothetical protein
MLVLSVRFRKPDMLEESMPGKRYVSLSALSGIFCRVGDDVGLLSLFLPRKIRVQFQGYKHTSLSRGNLAQDRTYQRLTEVSRNGVWR